MSLTATISTSAPDSCAARKTLRPMRPKPLIPTRTGMAIRNPFLARDGRGGPPRLSIAALRSPSARAHPCPSHPPGGGGPPGWAGRLALAVELGHRVLVVPVARGRVVRDRVLDAGERVV